jgi:hypothetical protein
MVRLKFRDPEKRKATYGRYKFDPETGLSLDVFPGEPSDYDVRAPREARDRTDKLLLIFLRSSERKAVLELVQANPEPAPDVEPPAEEPEPEAVEPAEPAESAAPSARRRGRSRS